MAETKPQGGGVVVFPKVIGMPFSIGYYDSPEQTEAVVDPGVEGCACLFCKCELNRQDIRTISTMQAEGATRSYFYRVHKSCHVNATQEERDAVDGFIFDMIEQRKAN